MTKKFESRKRQLKKTKNRNVVCKFGAFLYWPNFDTVIDGTTLNLASTDQVITWRLWQDDNHFADNSFKLHFRNEIIFKSKIVPASPINN